MTDARAAVGQIPEVLIDGINHELPGMIERAEAVLAEECDPRQVLSELAVLAYFAGYADSAAIMKNLNSRAEAMAGLYRVAQKFVDEFEDAIAKVKEKTRE